MAWQQFLDRRAAGRELGAALLRYADERPVVLALPRGGVPVGFEVARALHAPLDVVLVRKIGAPGFPELALGAVVDGAHPSVVINDDVLRSVAPLPGYVEAEEARQLVEIERRREHYRGSRPAVDVAGCTVIIVDDGIATGATAKAALIGVAQSHPARRVLAVPVASVQTLNELAAFADDIVCLAREFDLHSVGAHYSDFRQTSDEEVIAFLKEAQAA